MKRTIVRVVGARPQFMQAPLVRQALMDAGYRHLLVHTGQHYDASMSDRFFADLDLPDPDVNLGVAGKTHGAGTGIMMERLEAYLIDVRPDAVLVDGDTNSTMAAALAAVKLHVPVFHIEAGLRDFDRRRPEEINRIVTDHVSDVNFTPLPRASENLRIEGRASTIRETGDALLDCFLAYRERASDKIASRLGLKPGCYHLMTLHRPENTDLSEMVRFRHIMRALFELDKPIVFPVHPRTRPILDAFYKEAGSLGPIKAIEPVSYLEMLGLLRGADMVVTDSGGLPREAVWEGKRCVMLFRMDTWHDLLERRWAAIGKTDRNSILDGFAAAKPPPINDARALYGGGRAVPKIVDAITEYFGS